MLRHAMITVSQTTPAAAASSSSLARGNRIRWRNLGLPGGDLCRVVPSHQHVRSVEGDSNGLNLSLVQLVLIQTGICLEVCHS